MLLSEYPADLVRLACRRCGRRGQYRRSTLAKRFGADIGLPELLARLVDQAECGQRGSMSAPCGAYYVELAPPTPRNEA